MGFESHVLQNTIPYHVPCLLRISEHYRRHLRLSLCSKLRFKLPHLCDNPHFDIFAVLSRKKASASRKCSRQTTLSGRSPHVHLAHYMIRPYKSALTTLLEFWMVQHPELHVSSTSYGYEIRHIPSRFGFLRCSKQSRLCSCCP